MLSKDAKVRTLVIEIARDAGLPVSIDYVAKNAGLSWGTSRALLLELCLEGQIHGQRTSRGWVFHVSRTAVKLEDVDEKPCKM